MSDRFSQFEKGLLGLRSLVMGGALEANTRLPEVALAERLGISRTPLRKAMDRLVSEGLLERMEAGGCRVARFTTEDIRDAIELRGVIEGTAARMSAERGVSSDILDHADRVLDAIDDALGRPDGIDFDAYVHQNAEFHDLLSHMPGSAVIQREVERICCLPLASPSSFLQEQELIPNFQASLSLAQDHHRGILNAIRNREGARAEALTREHARLALRNFEYVTTAKPSLATRVPGLALVSAS